MSILTSMATVLCTSELFEAILLKLGLRDLLLAQSVSQGWKEAIGESPALQQKLFFAPINNVNENPYFNPLLQEVFPAFFQLDSVNLLTEYLSPYHIRNYISERLSIVLREDASWRRMLPVQPPAKIDVVQQLSLCCGNMGSQLAHFKEDSQHVQVNGATMGLIYDIAIQLLEQDSGTTFFIQWHMFLSNKPAESLNMSEDDNSQDDNLADEYPEDEDPDVALQEYEEEEARCQAFRAENKITIRAIKTYCYEPNKSKTGLMVRDVGQDIISL